MVPRALRVGIDLGLAEVALDPVSVLGEELLLREAFANLIDNALRYSSGPGAAVTVGVRIERGQVSLAPVEPQGLRVLIRLPLAIEN